MIGGASVGPHDHARGAMRQLNHDFMIDKISVKPGKPTWFGMTPRGPVLGLPGNPASALVCARLFLAPIIERFLGRGARESQYLIQAQTSAALPANGPRESYLRAILAADGEGGLRVRAHDDQDSALVTILAHSNVLLHRAPHAPHAPPGSVATCLSWRPAAALSCE